MASNTIATTTILLALNLVFFTLVSSTPCAPPAPKVPKVPTVPKVPKVPKVPTLPPNAKTPPNPKPTNYCPRDALKLGVCANVLNGLLNIVIGSPPSDPECCSVIQGLLDAEAAACLCTLIKADVVGIKLKIPVALSLLLNSCGKKLPKDFQCA